MCKMDFRMKVICIVTVQIIAFTGRGRPTVKTYATLAAKYR